MHADWKVIFGDEKFFSITKSFHNALQGAKFALDDELKEVYLSYNTKNAQLLEEQYDYIIVHDPQPLALLHFKGRGNAKWLWRCHIDTSEPNEEVWDFLKPFAQACKEFIHRYRTLPAQAGILPWEKCSHN